MRAFLKIKHTVARELNTVINRNFLKKMRGCKGGILCDTAGQNLVKKGNKKGREKTKPNKGHEFTNSSKKVQT